MKLRILFLVCDGWCAQWNCLAVLSSVCSSRVNKAIDLINWWENVEEHLSDLKQEFYLAFELLSSMRYLGKRTRRVIETSNNCSSTFADYQAYLLAKLLSNSKGGRVRGALSDSLECARVARMGLAATRCNELLFCVFQGQCLRNLGVHCWLVYRSHY